MANFQLLVLDEWLEKPDEGFRAFILEVMEGDSRRPHDLLHAVPAKGLA